ncbi:uncharacterized protein LOC134813166 [Bolinopsis microptera]|uniref:uncharacterized protein LOC134813166 n=1 Tax=Bolinopsis microptera TaxID=2820187 RepID=UPI00307AB1FE
MPIEVPTNTMCFLIFLPLTNGLVGMTAQNTPTVRGFLRNVFKQMVKFGFSYICLITGIVIAITSPHNVEKLSSFEDMIKMLETVLTLMCGVYIYYLVMNCTWGAVSIPKTLALTAAVTVIYPCMHYVIYEYWTKEKHIHDHEFVILGHASTPSSIYIQIYILKHIRCPTNYIAAFLLTNVFGGIFMYAFVIVKELFQTYGHKDNISPVDFYLAKDQWEFELTSALFLAVFAMLIYARLHQTSVLRKIIFITLLVELIANVVSLAGYLADTDKSPILPMILSAIIMVDHLGVTALTVLLFVYKYHPFVRRKWKALVTFIFMAAIFIPMILYTGTYLYFEKSINDHSLSFNNKSIYFYLDLRYKNDTSDLNISHPIGVISYTAINAIAICIYVAACCAAHYSRERSTDNEDLVETIEDSEDKEKYTACKVLFSYQFCVIVMGIAFGIRNIKYTKSWQESNSKWIDYSMEFIELSSLILADLAGTAMTLIFCISPGNMENEIKRFLHIPMKIRAYLTSWVYGYGQLTGFN